MSPEAPDTLPDPVSQQAYFPLQTGRYEEYQADSIIYDFAPGGGILQESSRTLVRREQRILDSRYCNQIPLPNDCRSNPWQEKAETGYILRQVITGFN